MTVYPNSADKWNNSNTEYCFYKVFSVNYENEEVPWFSDATQNHMLLQPIWIQDFTPLASYSKQATTRTRCSSTVMWVKRI